MSSPFHGIIIYEILENGNLLNAVYTNNGLKKGTRYYIDNEIARKNPYDQNGLGGSYECRFIQENYTTVEKAELKIVKLNEVYEFVWKVNNAITWIGIGMKAGNNHIAVSYSTP